MKVLIIISTIFFTLQTALAFEVKLKSYSIDGELGVDHISAILSSGARNLKDTNCIRGKLFNNYIHASAIAQGCYLERIDVNKGTCNAKLVQSWRCRK